MKELNINNRIWRLHEEFPDNYNWTANYICPDGDLIDLYIEKNGNGFTLECFSGIPSSHIYIDVVDYNTFTFNGKVPSHKDFIVQSLYIADYLCGLFCTYFEDK